MRYRAARPAVRNGRKQTSLSAPSLRGGARTRKACLTEAGRGLSRSPGGRTATKRMLSAGGRRVSLPAATPARLGQSAKHVAFGLHAFHDLARVLAVLRLLGAGAAALYTAGAGTDRPICAADFLGAVLCASLLLGVLRLGCARPAQNGGGGDQADTFIITSPRERAHLARVRTLRQTREGATMQGERDPRHAPRRPPR